jgi:hypothetical protein
MRHHLHFSAPIVAGALLLTLSACQQQPEAPIMASAGLCKDEAAQAMVGKPKPTDEEAKRLTGAKVVRQVAPGDPVTMDFQQDRVTIETDPSSGLVVRASCG